MREATKDITVRAVLCAVLAQMLTTVPMTFTGALAPLIAADFAFDPARLGTVVALYYAMSAFAAMHLGSVADRAGAWLVMSWGLALMALSTFAVAALADSFAALLVLLVVAGFSNGVVQPANNAALSVHVLPERQGLAFGIKQSSIPLATMAAGLAVPAIGLTVGWRWAFALAALAGTVLAIWLPRRSDRAPLLRPQADSPQLSARSLLLIAVVAGCATGTNSAMAAFLVPSTMAAGVPAAAAGFLLALGSAASIIVRTGSGWLADKHAFPRLPVIAGQLGLGAVAYVILAFADTWTMAALGAVLGFGMGWGWAALMMLRVVTASAGRTGRASGLMLAGSFVGATVGPFVFGWLVVLSSYATAWLAMAGVIFVAALLALVGHRMIERELVKTVSPRTAAASTTDGAQG